MDVKFGYKGDDEFPYSAEYIGFKKDFGPRHGTSSEFLARHYGELLIGLLDDVGELFQGKIGLVFCPEIPQDLQNLTEKIFILQRDKNLLEEKLRRILTISMER